MSSFLQSFKSRIKKSIMLSPKLHREYWFFKSNVRYIKRSLVGRNEWKNILKEPPILAGFNTIGMCNANCCYCAYMFHEPDGVMDMQIYEKGVRDFSDMGGGAIGLSPVTGEPLLDPYLSERIEFASQFNNIVKITFDTNGIMLKKKEIREELIRLSSKIQIQINISLPGFKKEVFERVYNVKWDEALLTGIKNLLVANQELENPMHITLVLQPDGEDVLGERNFRTQILPHIDEEQIVMVGGLRDNWCGQIQQQHLTGNMTLKRQLIFKNIPCEVFLDRHVDILANGDVRMCGCRFGKEGKHDDLVIGNIKEKSLLEIWFGDGPEKLCESYLTSDVPVPCRECSMYLPY